MTKNTSRLSSAVAIICGVEVAVAVVVGGAGIAAILRPSTLVPVAAIVVALLAIRATRTAVDKTPKDTPSASSREMV